MNNKIKWDRKLVPVNEEIIHDVENKLGIKFPDDYIHCVIENHGARPIPKVYDIGDKKGKVFGFLLSYDKNDDYYFIDEYNALKEILSIGVIPFADDPIGNNICFDYREDKDNPVVVYWDHEIAANNPEKAIIYICDNFTDLLEKLYNPDLT